MEFYGLYSGLMLVYNSDCYTSNRDTEWVTVMGLTGLNGIVMVISKWTVIVNNDR
jgi:hypothetical protein